MNKAKQFFQTNATLLGSAPRKKDVRHFILTSDDPADSITVPVCGSIEDNVVAKRRILGVTCVACLERIMELLETDSYNAAVTLYKQKAPKIKEPTQEEEDEVDAEGKPTPKAREKRELKKRMKMRGIKRANLLFEQVLGSADGTFYRSLTAAGLLTETGDVNQELKAQVQERINALSQPV